MDSSELRQKYNNPHFISSKTFPFNRACQVTDITHTDNFKYIILTGIGSTMDERYGGLLVKYKFYILMELEEKKHFVIFDEKVNSLSSERESKDSFAKAALEKFIKECVDGEYIPLIEQYINDIHDNRVHIAFEVDDHVTCIESKG